MATKMERFGPTHRGGPVFRWLGEALAIDLANTVMVVGEGAEIDLLATSDDLRLWLELEKARLGGGVFAGGRLDDFQRLRDAVRRLLTAAAVGSRAPDQALAHLNAASSASPVAPQLGIGPGGRFEVFEPADGDDRSTVLLAQLARSVIHFLTGTECGQLKICNAPSCGMFFTGSRRWCCSACGNRARAARHYRRAKKPKG
jgi:predicted RNA-binding Zn ribbon-like protein